MVEAIDEFVEVNDEPVRIDLKKRYPQSFSMVIDHSIWPILCIGVVLLGDYVLRAHPAPDQVVEGVDYAVGILFDYLLMIFIAITAVKVIYELLYLMMFNYTIEKDHLVITRGVLQRSRTSFPVAKINDASIKRTPIEWILGTCTLDILTASPSADYGAIEGLPKKEAVDLQHYLMLLVETTLPKISRDAVASMRYRQTIQQPDGKPASQPPMPNTPQEPDLPDEPPLPRGLAALAKS